MGKTEIVARTILVHAGFTPNVVQALDPTFPMGIVLAQAPDPGAVEMFGSNVTITVNTLIATPLTN